MHILFVHQNFPAQFGHIARYLVARKNYRCTFVTERVAGLADGVEKIQYKLTGGATTANHFCSRTFENTVWHSEAVYQALLSRPDVRPDLIVGHSGFGSTLFLRELYPGVPIVNFFEYYYLPHAPDGDMMFRHDLNWPIEPLHFMRAQCRNAMILLDLQNCDGGYTPTHFQHSRFPEEYRQKISVIFDGVDREIFHGHGGTLRPSVARRQRRIIHGIEVGPATRIVTYCSRGFESIRGFDQFMKSAKLVAEEFPDVLFFVVGSDRIAYGGDQVHTGGKPFKEWVLARDSYDLSKFHFLGQIPAPALGQLLASSDLHVYFTAPFVLSWSMMGALSCGAVVLASSTPPVTEMIRDGENGLLADFFDPAAFAQRAVEVLRDPDAFRPIGDAGERMIVDRYSLEAVLPEMLSLFSTAATQRRSVH